MYLMHKLFLLLLFTVANCTIAATAALTGSGTVDDPYLIQNNDDFFFFANQDNSFLWEQGVHIRLDADINLKTHTFSQAPIAGDPDEDTGFDGLRYSGCFDGNGKTISNLTVDCPSYAGLFGVVSRFGSVCNLTITNADMSCKGYYGGSICAYNFGIIKNCFSSGSVSGSDEAYYVGGLCGYSEEDTSILGCKVDMTVTGMQFVGILCGRNCGTMIDCFSDGSSTGLLFVGGLCGRNSGTINNSYSTGKTSGTGYSNSVGGFCGHNSGIIKSCYSTGNVSGMYYVGGLCGYNKGGTISFCYTSSIVTGESYLGGLLGFNSSGSVDECLADGDVTGNSYSAGLCGFNSSGSISDSFWNMEAMEANVGYNESSTKQGSETNVQGITNDQMHDINTFLKAGWDFVNETQNGTDDIWRMPYVIDAPILSWQRDIPGDITGTYGVDLEDFAVISKAWQSQYTIIDLQTFVQNWLAGLE